MVAELASFNGLPHYSSMIHATASKFRRHLALYFKKVGRERKVLRVSRRGFEPIILISWRDYELLQQAMKAAIERTAR
ncbi:type II toxin-antitoxin system prevent-host-death family antitoxin [uncultured Sphingomonas sp.]|uniref:type II toxin-antitoxin system prevent-host-death family antitoxin n=1 Tax=uncultured Sphingomonas sp. TaxID=158754 RepID=UPI0035CB2183